MKLIGYFEIRRIEDSTCGEIVYYNELAPHEDERITSTTQNEAQALHILHEEIEEAVSRANSRLKSGGLDKCLFPLGKSRKPKTSGYGIRIIN